MSVPREALPPGRPFAILCGMAFHALIGELHERLEKAGYAALRPAHGFVFQRVAGQGATAAEIASHLGITRQSTQQIIDELQALGYLHRKPNPGDARSKKVVLTPEGWRCLDVVEAAFRAIDREWSRRLGREAYTGVQAALAKVAEASNVQGPLRPTW